MARESDRKAAKTHRAGLKRHCAEQARHRAKNKADRRPERDDVAGAALRFLLNTAVRHPERAPAWTVALARDLAGLDKPFDPVKTTAVVEAMIERQRNAMEQKARLRAAERQCDA